VKTHFKHEVPLDLHSALPECAKTQPVEAKPVKRVPYDSLYVKQKRQRDSWSRN
jgi:hypothetical protein